MRPRDSSTGRERNPLSGCHRRSGTLRGDRLDVGNHAPAARKKDPETNTLRQPPWSQSGKPRQERLRETPKQRSLAAVSGLR